MILQHIHQFKRYKRGLFICADPHCTLVRPYGRVLNKLTRCNFCTNEFILDYESARRAKPRCLECSQTKKARAFKIAAHALDKLIDTGTEAVE